MALAGPRRGGPHRAKAWWPSPERSSGPSLSQEVVAPLRAKAWWALAGPRYGGPHWAKAWWEDV